MPQHTRPNVLLVVADQMRRDALGLNRPAFVHTPHLDQLAREGVNFTRAYSACPSCIAARASLMTGLRHENHVQDPQELRDLSVERADRTALWRGRLVEELSGRAEGYVENGALRAGRPTRSSQAWAGVGRAPSASRRG